MQEQAAWTWNIMSWSSNLGEMIREDAITSVNLSTINEWASANKFDMSITSFQGAGLEIEFGADWIWGLPDGPRFLIQAKKLDTVRRTDLMSYSIDRSQMETLINAASALWDQIPIGVIPTYVFYNSRIQNLDPKQAGCVALPAKLLSNFFEKRGRRGKITTLPLKDLITHQAELHACPWFKMFEWKS